MSCPSTDILMLYVHSEAQASWKPIKQKKKQLQCGWALCVSNAQTPGYCRLHAVDACLMAINNLIDKSSNVLAGCCCPLREKHLPAFRSFLHQGDLVIQMTLLQHIMAQHRH